MVPITLPIGSNRPMLFMGFGDSITNGDPDVPDGNGYRGFLQSMLRAHFGAGEIANEGIDGTNSDKGAARIGDSLSRVRPAFTLILYGTNDWNQCNNPPDCVTIPSLRSMVQQVKASGGHAFVGAIIPVNVGYDDRTPPSRQDWVIQMNALIKQMADEEGAVYVDLYGAFARSGLSGSALYVDHLHPTAARLPDHGPDLVRRDHEGVLEDPFGLLIGPVLRPAGRAAAALSAATRALSLEIVDDGACRTRLLSSSGSFFRS